jgi:ribosome-associated protein
LEIAHNIIQTLEDKKGESILLLDIHEIASFTDYFIICSGSSDRMLNSLANAVMETAKQQFDLLSKTEGQPSDGWLVVDLGDIIVHLFSPDQRDYYHLEQLWERGKVLVSLQ